MRIKNGKLVEVKNKAFKLECDIQRLFEGNLRTPMGLTMVRSDYTIKNKRSIATNIAKILRYLS